MQQQIKTNYTTPNHPIEEHINISSFIRGIDMAIFKVVIDYIVRNFDPTGINIVGLIDSFCQVLIKPALASFYKILPRGINYYYQNKRGINLTIKL